MPSMSNSGGGAGGTTALNPKRPVFMPPPSGPGKGTIMPGMPLGGVQQPGMSPGAMAGAMHGAMQQPGAAGPELSGALQAAQGAFMPMAGKTAGMGSLGGVQQPGMEGLLGALSSHLGGMQPMPLPGASGGGGLTAASPTMMQTRASANFTPGARPGGLTLQGGPGQGAMPLPGGATSTVQPMGGGGGGGNIFGGPALQPGSQPMAPSNPYAPPTMGGGGSSSPHVPGPRPPGVTTTGGPGGSGPGGFTTPGGGQGSIPLPPTTPATGGEQNGTPSFQDIINQQFGQGNPFGTTPAGPDPIAAARAQADAWAGSQLANLRERFAGTGLQSTSARSALEQGRTAGAAESGLGTNLAQLGVAQRGDDLNRMMQGMLGSGQLSLGQQQLPIQAIQALMGGGQTIAGLQESESLPPLLQMLMPFLTNFAPQRQTGYSTTR